jgi:hypothetical protein
MKKIKRLVYAKIFLLKIRKIKQEADVFKVLFLNPCMLERLFLYSTLLEL